MARYSRDFVKHIFLGRGVFTSPETVEVKGKTLKFDKVGEYLAVICCVSEVRYTTEHD